MAGFYPIIDGRHQIIAIFTALRKGGSSKINVTDESTEGDISGDNSVKGGGVASVSTPFPEK